MRKQKRKNITNCSIEHILNIVNASLTEQIQIRPVGSRMYELTTQGGGKMRGSLTCILFYALLLDFMSKNAINWDKVDFNKWPKTEK